MENKTFSGEDSVGMTDLQFTEYQKVCAERDALREKVRVLQENAAPVGKIGDLQFTSYKEERDKREALEKAELRREIELLRKGMTT